MGLFFNERNSQIKEGVNSKRQYFSLSYHPIILWFVSMSESSLNLDVY